MSKFIIRSSYEFAMFLAREMTLKLHLVIESLFGAGAIQLLRNIFQHLSAQSVILKAEVRKKIWVFC